MAGLSALAWSAFALAEVGRFNAWVALAAGAAAFAAVLARAAPAQGPRWSRLERAVVAALALGIAVASIPPGEAIRGSWDPGVYLHTAAGIVRHGALNFPAEDLATLPANERAVVSRDLNGVVQPYPGMFVLPDGRFAPQFQHLFPALLAVAMALGGIWAALVVNPALAAGAVFAVHALARRFVPGPWALAAPAAFVLNPALVWQAKFPTSELLAQLLLTAGAVFLVDALEGAEPRTAWALLAGCSLGMALLARYDALLVLAPLAVILALLAARPEHRRTVALVLAPIAAIAGHAAAHARFAAPYYAPMEGLVGPLLGAAAVAVAAVLAARRVAAGRRAWEAAAACAPQVRVAAAAALLAWAALSWWVRPSLAPAPSTPVEGFVAHLHRFVAGAGRDDFLYLVDLLGAPGVLVALGGVALLLGTARTRGRAAWLFPAAGVVVLFGTHVFHDRTLPWVLRRFVPVALPLLAIGVAAAASAAAAGLGRLGRRVALAGGLAVATLALAPNLGATLAMARQREWPGLVRWCEQVAQAVPAGATVFTDVNGFGAPLRFLYSLKTYEYNRLDESRKPLFFRVLRRRAARGEAVFLLTRPGPLAARGLSFQEAGRFPLRSSAIGTSRHGVPRVPQPRSADLVLYRVATAPVDADGEDGP